MINRRDFMKILALAGMSGIHGGYAHSAGRMALNNLNTFNEENFYTLPSFGNVTLMHITDVHAQLLPVYFREPSMNIGLGEAQGRPPHIVGERFLDYYKIPRNSAEAHALTYINFVDAARQYGKMGGYAHLATLVKRVKAQRKQSLLLDGGDTWQGSATALWTNAQDMVDASLKLGVDIMTGHWEFTFGAQRVKHIVNNDFKDKLDFVAHNITDKEFGDGVFKPYVIRELNGVAVAVIGQAFPYTPIANPSHMFPEWSFGIREQELQTLVDNARQAGAQVVVLLSHNGMDVDIKLAGRLSGIDIIFGGHTHDAVPQPVIVNNTQGKTLVINSGSAGKFLSVLDLNVVNKKVMDFRFRLLPVFSNLLPPDPQMQSFIDDVRKPYLPILNEKLAVTNQMLYRRGTFNGSFDQIILDALMEIMDTEIAFSPGFRWGMTILPGDAITFEDVMTQTAITYPVVTVNHFTGEQLKSILEDVADNIFHHDPYYQQGGDMVRVGGLTYTIDPTAGIGKRISDMRVKGKPLQADKKYKVAGWASVSAQQEGTPVWDVVAHYLRSRKEISVPTVNIPIIKNVARNPGIARLI